MKKTITAWAVFVKDKIRGVYEDEQEALFVVDVEKYMRPELKSKRVLAAHVKSIKLRRVTISWEEKA